MNTKRLRREESFVGIHFDFHASEKCIELGKNVTPEMIEYIIETVKPDYIQCDCKGHPGFSSYPTKVGNPVPHFIKDQLKIWRDVTAKHNIALYMHYSGVWDTQALNQHPKWASEDKNGKKSKVSTSVFGKYIDKLLIPQIKELIDNYNIDGIWIDGDCWGVQVDYSKNATQKFKKETGIATIPKEITDPYFLKYVEFCREGFRKYLQHYVDELHTHKPDFQICSNWAYSAHMPEKVSANVDFLSGDYTLIDSVNSARMEARFLRQQGKPWDLMAWGFTSGKDNNSNNGLEGCFTIKSTAQLQQEAAMTISQGGGFQVYFNQKTDGSICKWQMKIMKEVVEFCRARQEVCHKTKPVPQIALLYSTTSFFYKKETIFSIINQVGKNEPIYMPLIGVLRSLLESQNVVDIVTEYNLDDNIERYPLIIIPEWKNLTENFKHKLLNYVSVGGNLLLIGPATAYLFKDQLNVSFKKRPKVKENYLEYKGLLCGLKTFSREVNLQDGAVEFGKLYKENDTTGKSTPAGSISNYGKGKIAAIYVNLGERYCNATTHISRDFLNAMVYELFPEPVVEVKGTHFVDVSLNKISNKLTINLINTSGPHGNPNIYVYDEIPEINNLEISIRVPKKPLSVTLEPGKKDLNYTYISGKITLTLSSLKIHNIIVVDF